MRPGGRLQILFEHLLPPLVVLLFVALSLALLLSVMYPRLVKHVALVDKTVAAADAAAAAASAAAVPPPAAAELVGPAIREE